MPDVPHQHPAHTGSQLGINVSKATTRVQHWVVESRWPERDFEPDPNLERSALCEPRPTREEQISYSDESDQGSTRKAGPYAYTGYGILLKLKGGYMSDSKAGISTAEGASLQLLLTNSQKAPSNTLFDDHIFFKTCAMLRNRNKMRVVVDMLRLIVPSAEKLAAQGLPELDCLRETTNDRWTKSIPIEGPRPQPDFAVGFDVMEFSTVQIKKIDQKLRPNNPTYFSATLDMFFPFLTCEVTCDGECISIADRRNAHSMTIAIRGVVELYRQVERAKELQGKVLGFSISLDVHQVRIYAHYAEIDGLKTKCYRHTLREFFIAGDDGKNKWLAYQFTLNVYQSFALTHLQRIKSAIDQLPDPFAKPSESASSVGSDVHLPDTTARSASLC